ncbi:metallophosphoesterase family protein [Methyloversatilis universalis]|uniref:metallophosphoesterase family protein n=1 Tax=Methyloversatilis universalis TaxID=378211 RepID=UPI00035CF1FF|nr:DNA repair exonuclease [Methyloversatilis universalis]
MLKILHTADWQIGKQYGQFEPDEAVLLAEARIAVVERLAALATEQQVDLVLVAGDVFDAQGIADKTVLRLFNATRGFAGPWVMLPGNHDAALSESVWSRAQRLAAVPDHVHLCLRPEPLHFEGLNAVLLPAPLTQRHTYADLTEWFAAADTPPGAFRIGLAHGAVQGVLAEGIDSANPIAADRAAQARLDYLALGDWHGCRQIDARCWYSGTPETDRFRNNDSGCALRVDIDAPGTLPQVSVLQTGRYRWRSERVLLQVASDIDALCVLLDGLQAGDVLQLELAGQTDLAGLARVRDALAQAQGRARALRADLDPVRIEPTDDDLARLAAEGYLGEVIADLRAAQDSADGDTARDALVLLAGLLDARRTAGEAR